MSPEYFLAQYSVHVKNMAMQLRQVVVEHLPHIHEEVDVSAKIVAYSYGKRYDDLICVIIPSKKGLKLGFNRGIDLPDPKGLLEGMGKISRYVVIQSEAIINSKAISDLLMAALAAYYQRVA